MNTIEVGGTRYELASLLERWLGQFLDGVIYAVIFIVPTLLLRFALGSAFGPIIGFVAAILYLLFQDGLENGQSWGKRVVKTKVIDSRTGGPCTFGQSFVRNFLLSLLNIIDWIFIFGANRQRLGDKAANTLVVKQ